MKITKSISILIIPILFLTACGTSGYRYPEYRETVKVNNEVSIVIDTTILRAIDGPHLGFNAELNAEKLVEIENQLIAIFTERGFKPTIVESHHSLSIDPKSILGKERELFLSKEWKSLEIPYVVHQPESIDETDDQAWFIKTLMEVARKINYGRKRTTKKVEESLKKQKEEDGEEHYYLHELVSNQSFMSKIKTDQVIVITINGLHLRTNEIVGRSILPALASGLLTGGLLIITPTGTINIGEMAVYDHKLNKVSWYSRSSSAQTFKTESVVNRLFKAYPYSDGKNPRRKKQERLKDRL